MNNLSGSLSFNGNVSGQMGANLIPSVEANPSGTATEILTSIRVGDIIYSIPSGGGGGGGTNDYNSLLNKPQINGVTLEGDKSSSDLHLISEVHNVGPAAEVNFEADDMLPLLNCICEFEPSQDLHGYSKPWAGGAGKNKIPNTQGNESKNGVTCTKNSDGTYTFTGTASASSYFIVGQVNIPAGTYTLSGCPTGGGSSTYRLYFENPIGVNDTGSGTSFTISEQTLCNAVIVIVNGCVLPDEGIVFEPMVRLSTEPSTFEPYSNICPISGHTDVTVTVASTSGGSGEDYTVSLGTTYYGGNLDVTTGELEVTWGNIASYAGETLTGEWLSSLDEYSPLGTPTTGAQVVYELSTPQTFTLTEEQIQTLLGQNYVRCDTGDIQVTYATDIVDPLLKWLLENR